MYDDVQKTGGWIFVIDTDEYAGNFERAMTAYVTGCVGECEVGEEFAARFKSELGEAAQEEFYEVTESRPDDHGCHRPCAIYPTEGWYNNGNGEHFKDVPKAGAKPQKKAKYPAYLSVAIFFNKKPTKVQIQLMKDRANKFVEASKDENKKIGFKFNVEQLNITGFRLLKEHIEVTEEEI